jgi:predicted hydrocarbon binding protein
MMKPDEVVPRARNFYREEDYFTLNVRSGVVRSPLGTRMVAIPEDLVLGLHLGLEEETGGAAGIVLYQCGKWWGRQFIKRHGTETRHFYQQDHADLPLHFFLQTLRRIWALYGWGRLDLSFELRDKGFVSVSVENAMYSDAVGNVGRTTDYVIAGVLASVVGDLSGRELECAEVSCKSKGDARCEFLVGIKSRVDIVATWVKQGRTRAEILAAIAQGQLV